MTTIITVQNLKCGGCANTITTNLSTIQNISDIEVDVTGSSVSFQSISAEDATKVREKLKTLGYPSLDDSNSLTSKAKSFVSCATGKISK